MDCSECNEKLGLKDLFKIVNPHSFRCQKCNAHLSLEKNSLIVMYLFFLFWVLAIGIYFYFIKNRYGGYIGRTLFAFIAFVPSLVWYFKYFMSEKAKTVLRKTIK